jgi:hypothetical protein
MLPHSVHTQRQQMKLSGHPVLHRRLFRILKFYCSAKNQEETIPKFWQSLYSGKDFGKGFCEDMINHFLVQTTNELGKLEHR